MSFKAVLFDLDGTLLDTIADLSDSMNAVLSRFGFPIHDEDAYKRFVGKGMENLVRAALPEPSRTDSSIVSACLQNMRDEYGRRWSTKTKPYEDIPELLDELSARHLELAILSNKQDDFTKAMVAQLLPHWHFAVVIGERPTVPRKPDPAAALEIARNLQILPGGFIYLGDTNIDMMTACAAGMYAVGVLWGFRGAAELQVAGAKMLLARPLDLLTLLT